MLVTLPFQNVGSGNKTALGQQKIAFEVRLTPQNESTMTFMFRTDTTIDSLGESLLFVVCSTNPTSPAPNGL